MKIIRCIEIPDDLAQDPWIKVVEMLQQNWAVIVPQDKSALVVFYSDDCGVFDEIKFDSQEEAEEALTINGFSKYRENLDNQKFIGLPRGDFHVSEHPNGPIYSSGRFWTPLTRDTGDKRSFITVE